MAVTSETANELDSLKVSLASVGTFQQFGLDRAAFLSDFKFNVVSRGGRSTIHITSARPVVEPFVTLLLEIRWGQGRLLREYAVLLDPPAFAAEQIEPAVQEPVAGPAPIPEPTQILREPGPVVAEPLFEEPEPVAAPSVPVEPAPAVPAEAEPTRATPVPAEPEPVPTETAEPAAFPVIRGGYGEVMRNDTLWAIAGRVSDGSVNRNQLMLAIYRTNPEAFAGKP